MADLIKKPKEEKKLSKKYCTKLNYNEKKILAKWVGERILESQEAIEQTLKELSIICDEATKE